MHEQILAKLNSDDTWTKALALYCISTDEISNLAILAKTLDLLEDTSLIEVPSRPLTDNEKELAILTQAPPMEDYNPEVEALGPKITLIRDLAEYTLDKNHLPASEEVLKIIERFARQELPLWTRMWLDENFYRFPWPDERKAFKRYAIALVECEYPYMRLVLERIDSEQVTWLAQIAAGKVPQKWGILRAIVRRFGRNGARAVIEALEDVKASLHPNILSILAEISRFDDLRERSAALMKRAEQEGEGMAAGYLCVLHIDAAAGERFRKWLEQEQEIDSGRLMELDGYIDHGNPPQGFPFVPFFTKCKRDYSLNALKGWRELKPEIRSQALWRIADEAENLLDAFQALSILAEAGNLKEDPEGASRFWESLRERLKKDKSTETEPHDFIERGEQVLRLANPETKPVRLEEAIIGYLTEDLILPSVAAKMLQDWKPDEHSRKVLREAIAQEVSEIERLWEEEKDARYRNPSEYWYDDRKAPWSVLWQLESRWKEMRELALKIGGLENAITKIDELIAVPWQKVLRGITERTE
jgi:hypothetical protein